MKAINKLINEFYEKYKGLPSNNPIVRMNQKNDINGIPFIPFRNTEKW